MLKEKKLALNLAKKAVAIQLKHYGHASFRNKGARDLVGQVDEEINALCIREIKKAFPHDGVMSEEGSCEGENNRLWVIDPLDGTVNYANNIPLFCFALAFFENNAPKMSLVSVPLLKEFYYAEKGKGAFLNGKRLRCCQNIESEKTLLSFSDLSHHTGSVNLFLQTSKNFMGSRTFGCTSLEFCWVAAEKFGARVKPKIKPWDLAPGCFMVEQAGGVVTDFSGKKWSLESNDAVAAVNGRILQGILKLVR